MTKKTIKLDMMTIAVIDVPSKEQMEEITEWSAYDWLYDYDYNTSRLVLAKCVLDRLEEAIVEAKESKDGEFPYSVPASVKRVVKLLKELDSNLEWKVMFNPLKKE